MPKGYSHLTRDQRSQIYALLSSGFSQTRIAKQLGISQSTISREIKRNTGLRGYRIDQAQRLATARRVHASSSPRKFTPQVQGMVEEKLQAGWSPEQISGRLKIETKISISAERIYLHVWNDKKLGGTLYLHLRRKAKPYNRRANKAAGRGCIPNRVGIEKRPPIVDLKVRRGDWEADTIIGAKHQGVILSVVDRKSKFTVLKKMTSKSSEETSAGIIECLQELPWVKTITCDNGREFSGHADVCEALKVKVYFANPYCSWERGLNEHTNGLVREYIPKSTNIHLVNEQTILDIQNKLNNRPRKVLNYKTPSEVFNSTSISNFFTESHALHY